MFVFSFFFLMLLLAYLVNKDVYPYGYVDSLLTRFRDCLFVCRSHNNANASRAAMRCKCDRTVATKAPVNWSLDRSSSPASGPRRMTTSLFLSRSLPAVVLS